MENEKRKYVNHCNGKVLFLMGDGKNHLNIYSSAHTTVGRKLSNFYKSYFQHPVYGDFMSMEAYWNWLCMGKNKDHLRSKFGMDAKKSRDKRFDEHNPRFEQDVIEGIHCKLIDNPHILDELLTSDLDLPFTHYYLFCNSAKDVFKQSRFWIQELELIRNGKPLMDKDEML